MWSLTAGRRARAAVAVVLGAGAVLAATPFATAATDESPAPVVLLGASGLTWSDIDEESTPAIADFVSGAAVGHLSVRSVFRVTCPVDAWLTVSAARRAAAERVPGRDESDNSEDLNAFCTPVPRVIDGEVQRWDSLVEYNDSLSFNATLGLLGQSAEEAGTAVLAAGPGGGVAAADEQGRVARYIPDPGSVTEQDLAASAITLLDLGGVDERDRRAPPRDQQVQAIDDAVARALAIVPPDATVMLVAGANSRPTAELQMLAIRGPAYPHGLLRSSSTKQDGLVLLTDLTPTIFDLAGLPPSEEFVGAPVTTVPSDRSWVDLRQSLVNEARKVTVYSEVAQPFFTALVPLQIALYGAAAWALRRRASDQRARRRILTWTATAAIICSAIPVASFLANLVPWWTWTAAHAGLVGLVLGIAVVVGGAARWVGRSHDILADVGFVAGVTAGVLALDIMTGGTLQTASLMGYSPVIAGRLYGFGNVAFSLFATALIFVTAWWGDLLHRRGRQRLAAWCVLLMGVIGVVIDGLPMFGSDFGGMLAIATGFGVFFLGARGIRITVWRVAAVFAVGVVTVVVVSVLDWLRPASERSHLGRFVDQVLDGELVDIVSRKLANNLDILFSSVLGLLVPFAVLFLALVLLRPVHQMTPVLKRAYEEAPLLRPALMGWVALMAVGFALNDSGVAIPAVGIMLTIPFLIVISARVMCDRPPTSTEADSSPVTTLETSDDPGT